MLFNFLLLISVAHLPLLLLAHVIVDTIEPYPVRFFKLLNKVKVYAMLIY
jgi:hypothetical protein